MPDSGSSHENLGRTRLVGWVSLIALAVVALGLFVGCTVVLPRYLASGDLDHAKVTPTELAQARNDVRTTLLQGLGGLVLLIGAYLTWRQTQLSRAASRDELRLAREGQLTNRFTHAVEQLGSDNVAVVSGGSMRWDGLPRNDHRSSGHRRPAHRVCPQARAVAPGLPKPVSGRPSAGPAPASVGPRS